MPLAAGCNWGRGGSGRPLWCLAARKLNEYKLGEDSCKSQQVGGWKQAFCLTCLQALGNNKWLKVKTKIKSFRYLFMI